MQNIWITWHREDKIKNKDIVYNNVENTFNFIISKYQNNVTFHLGWANWIDNFIWKLCLKYNINFILHLPFRNILIQTNWWTEEQKSELLLLKKNAIKIYYYNWYFERNRWIVDNSETIYYYCLNYNSWTGHTINYAKKNNKQVLSLI